ncbi:MAG: DUF1573 domain-containing protein [Bacteroidetes bacterium]|nr:DUF1573 domain-containing protein [Bacteroidota bacterium]MBU1578015.1 DUF1573 domain-containing protein [Bacteroidota bacterium]MBU2556827.1 DUF1573 domain-containing protein [Bacteroidota bacterium]
MRKLVLFLGILFAVTVVNAQQNTESKSANGPEITFDETIYDYGEIVLHGDGTHEFEFTNTGNEPLILSRPRSSCGCTVPTWPKQPILPGDKEKIKVTYNTNKAGSFNKSVTIMSNAKNSSTVVLRIKGKVVNEPAEALPSKQADNSGAPVNK